MSGRIYKLVSKIDEKVFVGVTMVDLISCYVKHKSRAKTYTNVPVYAHFNSIGWENVNIELIEEVKQIGELLARAREIKAVLKPELSGKIRKLNKRESQRKWWGKQIPVVCGCGLASKVIINHIKSIRHKAWVAAGEPENFVAPKRKTPKIKDASAHFAQSVALLEYIRKQENEFKST